MEHSLELEHIRKAIQGDSHSMGVLYDLYVQDVYRFLYFKTKTSDIAEDLLGDVFEKVVSSIYRFDEHKASFRTWIYTIARNTVIDYYRTQTSYTQYSIEDAWDIPSTTDLNVDTDTILFSEEVSCALEKLSSHERDIIVMRIWHEMTYDEIACVLRKSTAHCRVLFQRSIHKLKKHVLLAFILIVRCFI